MKVLTRHPELHLTALSWPAELARRLEERHIAAWSRSRDDQALFAASFGDYLRSFPDTDVCEIDGRGVADLGVFCSRLRSGMSGVDPAGDLRPSIDGPDGLVAFLRTRWSECAFPAVRRRFYLWHHADELLRADAALFGTIVDAITGVAAEAEYTGDDLLVIHRAVFVGSAALDMYAEDPRGQFRGWLREGQGRPLWQVITGVRRPRVAAFHIPHIVGDPASRS
ncbi:MAG: hypothetical protein KF745_07435 [Phycisphaeraceae bacterium]|nr:hypothetical protein [Phycisphaeraceae bacterium]